MVHAIGSSRESKPPRRISYLRGVSLSNVADFAFSLFQYSVVSEECDALLFPSKISLPTLNCFNYNVIQGKRLKLKGISDTNTDESS